MRVVETTRKARAGLYKQLSELQALLGEFREDPGSNGALKPAIADAVLRAGMQKDCPFRAADAEVELTPDNVDEVDGAEFEEYCARLYGCAVLQICWVYGSVGPLSRGAAVACDGSS